MQLYRDDNSTARYLIHTLESELEKNLRSKIIASTCVHNKHMPHSETRDIGSRIGSFVGEKDQDTWDILTPQGRTHKATTRQSLSQPSVTTRIISRPIPCAGERCHSHKENQESKARLHPYGDTRTSMVSDILYFCHNRRRRATEHVWSRAEIGSTAPQMRLTSYRIKQFLMPYRHSSIYEIWIRPSTHMVLDASMGEMSERRAQDWTHQDLSRQNAAAIYVSPKQHGASARDHHTTVIQQDM